ncbi:MULTISPECIES: hypothetical protein [unclassified Caulobacter]|uniref:hypothetical protein n=1 Tax=unclassified Caulobacter TaxID=2648921 RepID=UPI000D368EE7|nr:MULTISPECIES: hypothetical protein [unclassified Caulobacter]PTS89436.1 hypothetical protein DBR21_06445 [Caulobacter sp. HMWF009]PTT04552.1 hypothetical protein DBR10_18380 [Caulobacter sp. HMWF025]PTT80274.1 hypothetical protein DBR41_20315 [Pseudomonas sp. HMWF010]
MSRNGALFAACLLLCAPLSSALAQTPPASKPVSEKERSDFRAGLASSAGGQTFALVIKHYPEEFRAFETELLSDLLNGRVDMAGVQTRTFNFMMSIRTRMAPNVRRAPTPKLVAFGEAQLSLMKTLLPIAPRVCYEYAELGGPTPEAAQGAPRTIDPYLNAQNAVQFDVAIAGETSPTPHDSPNGEDFSTAFAEFSRRKGDADWLKAMSIGAPRTQTDSQRCAAAIVWIESILSQPPERAARLLAG